MGGIADIVDAQADLFQPHGLITHATVFPVEASHLIGLFGEVNIGLTGYGLSKPKVCDGGVASEGECESGTGDRETVGKNLP